MNCSFSEKSGICNKPILIGEMSLVKYNHIKRGLSTKAKTFFNKDFSTPPSVTSIYNFRTPPRCELHALYADDIVETKEGIYKNHKLIEDYHRLDYCSKGDNLGDAVNHICIGDEYNLVPIDINIYKKVDIKNLINHSLKRKLPIDILKNQMTLCRDERTNYTTSIYLPPTDIRFQYLPIENIVSYYNHIVYIDNINDYINKCSSNETVKQGKFLPYHTSLETLKKMYNYRNDKNNLYECIDIFDTRYKQTLDLGKKLLNKDEDVSRYNLANIIDKLKIMETVKNTVHVIEFMNYIDNLYQYILTACDGKFISYINTSFTNKDWINIQGFYKDLNNVVKLIEKKQNGKTIRQYILEKQRTKTQKIIQQIRISVGPEASSSHVKGTSKKLKSSKSSDHSKKVPTKAQDTYLNEFLKNKLREEQLITSIIQEKYETMAPISYDTFNKDYHLLNTMNTNEFTEKNKDDIISIFNTYIINANIKHKGNDIIFMNSVNEYRTSNHLGIITFILLKIMNLPYIESFNNVLIRLFMYNDQEQLVAINNLSFDKIKDIYEKTRPDFSIKKIKNIPIYDFNKIRTPPVIVIYNFLRTMIFLCIGILTFEKCRIYTKLKFDFPKLYINSNNYNNIGNIVGIIENPNLNFTGEMKSQLGIKLYGYLFMNENMDINQYLKHKPEKYNKYITLNTLGELCSYSTMLFTKLGILDSILVSENIRQYFLPQQTAQERPQQTAQQRPLQKAQERPLQTSQQRPLQTPQQRSQQRPLQTPQQRPQQRPQQTAQQRPQQRPQQTAQIKLPVHPQQIHRVTQTRQPSPVQQTLRQPRQTQRSSQPQNIQLSLLLQELQTPQTHTSSRSQQKQPNQQIKIYNHSKSPTLPKKIKY